MRRFGIILLTLVLLSVAAWAEVWTLSPGKGIGPLTINMTKAEAAQVLNIFEEIKGSQFIKYGADENVTVLYQGGRAVMISLHKKTLATKKGGVTWTVNGGVTVGTPWNIAESNLGRDYISRALKVARSQAPQTYYAYKNLGLGFRTSGGTIVQVDIF